MLKLVSAGPSFQLTRNRNLSHIACLLQLPHACADALADGLKKPRPQHPLWERGDAKLVDTGGPPKRPPAPARLAQGGKPIANRHRPFFAAPLGAAPGEAQPQRE